MKMGFALLVLVVGACTEANPAATCSMGTCIDPAFPYCDTDGLIGGTPGACIAVSCSSGEIAKCADGNALTCNAAGNGYDRVACSLDCLTSPTPHCATIEPRYLPVVCDVPAADDMSLSGTGSFDPNLDSGCDAIVPQTGGPDICVIHHRSITVSADAVVTFTGMPHGDGRAVALVADESLSVAGIIDASAHGHINGPGGGVTISGGPANVNQGGGGAGGRTDGAAGANSSTDGGAANGGTAVPDPALLAALIGGASSYKLSATDDPTDALGAGGGGGALTLIACKGTVSVGGTINVGGGGGKGGFTFGVSLAVHGAGGGAGGYLSLQGASVSITGRVFANGGGGGNGRQGNGNTGSPGPDGSLSASMPALADTPQDNEGRGGAGGVASAPPTFGLHPTASGATGGGGGGSVGFLQVYTPRGVDPMLTPTEVSPPFQANGTIPIR